MEYSLIEVPRQAGVCVRRAREARHMSRSQLARQCGVSERSIASLELGDARGIRLDKLLAVLWSLDLVLAIGGDGGKGVDARQVEDALGSEHDAPSEGNSKGAGRDYGDVLSDFLARQGMGKV